MQTEHDGISIWYGTPDTPGPDKTATAGVPVSITVGIQPIDASNAAEVRYCVNHGSLEMVAARWLRNDPFGKAQYFRASLPAFQAGDYVEYMVVCRCAGRQVPSLEEAEQFTASFRVIEAVDQACTVPTASLGMPVIGLAPTIPPDGIVQPLLEGAGLAAGEPEQLQPSPLAQPEMDGAKNGDLPVVDQRVEWPVVALDEVHRTGLGNLLETSPHLAGKGLQETIANLYDSHTGTAEEYWSALRQNPDFKQEGIVEHVQWTLQVGALTGYHLPLIAELQHMAQTDPSLKDVSAFAKLDEDNWRTILQRPQADGKPLALPEEVPGEDREEKIGNYARMLAGMVEAAFPTQVIAHHMEKDDDPSSPFATVKTDMQTFFRNNPAFDFRTTLVDAYLKEHQETALTGLSNAPGLVQTVKNMKRVFNVTPRYTEIGALLAGGLHSAQDIARLAPHAFVDQYALPLGGPLQARQIYARAQQNAAMALTLFGQLSVAVNQLEPYVITGDPTGQALSGRLGDSIAAEYRNLFGSIDFCNCTHCQSVYGPAAYLVDLLAHMKTIPAHWQVSPGLYLSSALDVLLFPGHPAGIHSLQGQDSSLGARRPDIGYIELTCENTNTLLPYVDLVNEILENAVALDAPNPQPGGGARSAGAWPGDAFKRQTSGTAEELGANPEHLKPAAYIHLRNAVYPWSLPFSLCIEEARTYLKHLGVPRHAIMEAFFDESRDAPAEGEAREALIDGIPANALSDSSIAREYLGLTSKEVELITGESSESDWQLWGLDQSNNFQADPADGRAKPATGSWDQVLKRVSIFLQQAGFSYIELLELLGTRFINPFQPPPGVSNTFTIGIVSTDPQDSATCNLSQLELLHLDREAPREALGRMHRFLRLQRKLGWTIGDLDRAIAALRPRKNSQTGQLDLTEAFLTQLSHIERLRRTLNVALETMLSWWAPIDTQSYTNHTALGQPVVPSLYARLFRNKNVLNPLDPNFPEDAGSLSGKILEHGLAVTAALQISAADLVLLVNDASVIIRMTSNDQLPDDILNLDNISRLYRHITLAKALKLSTRDFLSLKALIGSDPFASTQATLRFVQQVETIRSSGFNIAELDYVLRHRALPSINLALPEASIALVLAEIRGGLQRIGVENIIQHGDAREIIRTKLIALLWESSLIDSLVSLLDGSVIYDKSLESLPQGIAFPPESLTDRAVYDRGNKKLSFKGLMTQTEKTALLLLSSNTAYQGAVNNIFEAQRTFIEDQTVAMLDGSAASTLPLNKLPQEVGLFLGKASKGKASYDFEAKQLRFFGVMTATEKSVLLNLSADQLYRSAVEGLFTSLRTQVITQLQQAAPEGKELDNLFDRLQEYICRSFSEGLVIHHLAEALKLEVEAMGLLLSIPVEMPDGKVKQALALFRDMPLTRADGKDDKDPMTAATFLQQFNGYKLLHKIAMVVSKLRISPKELRWILHNTPQTGWLDLAKLPLDSSRSALFATWERLVAAIHLRDSLPTGEPALFDLFDLAAVRPSASSTIKNRAKQDFLELLSKRADWPLAELETLLGRKNHSDESGLLGLAFPGDYQDERLFVRLQTCFKVLKRLGVPARQTGDWGKADIDLIESDAQNAKRAAKAKYEEDEWLNVAKPLRDTLREKQRAALVAYLLHAYGLRDPNSLYEHFLIDVEMDPCQMTTRVKQAISSVQLFVQRSQMNLEPGIAMHAEDVRRWKWMKNYRVWEANRKVFFHPENWIEPELRDDTSPFFKELENELMQNDVTMETAETALMQYLEKLDEVSRLEICGMYHQKEGDIDVVHVFGRTRGLPHVYYYRRRIDSSYWTAWEKVDADIEGNHLIPVVWNRRLHLFWPVFNEKLKKRAPLVPTNEPQETTRRVTQWTKWGSPIDLGFFFGASGDMRIDSNNINIIGFSLPITVECKLDPGFDWDGAKYELCLNFTGSRGHGANLIGRPWPENTQEGAKVKAYFHVGIDCTQSTPAGWLANKSSGKCTSTEAVGSASVQFRVMEYKYVKEPAIIGSGQPQPGDPGIEAEKYQEIQLAWSEYRNGKWSGKKVTPKSMKLEILDPPEESRKYFTFRVLAENPLTIGCYRTIEPKLPPPPKANKKAGTTDISFGGVSDVLKPTGVTSEVGNQVGSSGSSGTLATTPSSGLEGTPQKNGKEPLAATQGTKTSTEVPIWQLGEFQFLGSDKYGEVAQTDSSLYDSISPEPLISGAFLKVEEVMVTQRDPLEELKGVVQLPILELYNQRILSMTPSRFRLLFSPRNVKIDLQAPFFYQDDTRTFFIAQKTVEVSNPVTDITRDIGGTHIDVNTWRKQYFEKFQKLGIGLPLPRLPGLKMPVNPPGDPYGPRSPGIGPDVLGVDMGNPTAPVVNPAVVPSSTGNLRGLARTPSPLQLSEEGRRVNPSMAIQSLPVIPVTGSERSVIVNVSARDIERTLPSIKEVADSNKSWYMSYIQHYVVETNTEQRYQFQIFYHPFVGEFIRQLNHFGIPGLLDPAPDGEKPELRRQRLRDLALSWYTPNPKLVEVAPYLPEEQIDFSSDGPYSLYNWELFFHIPLLIAMRLSQNQRFEEAQKWFHYIFDPTATDSPDNPFHPGPERFWKFKPFYDETRNHKIQTIQELVEDAKKLDEQVKRWLADPFKPHLIARMRIVAYQKAVVMKYIDNLIAWGDQLFRRETLESINEATHLYVLAARMLGKRPDDIPERAETKAQTFNQIRTTLDTLSNASAESEHFLSPSVAPLAQPSEIPLPHPMLYFCIPKNDRLLGYWDTAADRLYKIRHCMNIEGLVRQLPLFEPPIDPILLVHAAAAGVDIGTVLSDLNASLPHYRFSYMVQKALEVCAEVKSLGAALLSALEKRDAEQLSNIRAGHEVSLLKAARHVKEQQLAEAKEALNGLAKACELTTIRHQYYESIQYMNPGETAHLTSMEAAQVLQGIQAQVDFVGNTMSLIPNIKAASPTSAGATFGGDNLGQAIKAYSSYLAAMVAIRNASGSMSATIGGYQRRWDDWKLQEKLAAKELEQIDRQIAAAEIRKGIAQLELDNHDKQIESAKEIEEFLSDKFTNQELYNWMVGQISGIYFQSYQMVYDIAKRSERAYRHELGLADSNFIQFGYWDSVRKGLLAGEKLHYDLKRMDVAYLDQNKREYEITKHVSLVLHDPLSLITLKETGRCEVELPEALFDADYPGHYMRRLKSVSLTIPAVVGPYTSINCTLTLLSNKTRINSNAHTYIEQQEDQVISNFGAIQSITTSHAQNDSGLFELNFRDERYLPFEGSGAVSRWRIDMPKDTNAFDFNTLSDVVLHLKYTAREGGDSLKKAAKDAMQEAIADAAKTPLARLFSAKHEFPTDWHRFLHPADPAPGKDIVQKLPLALTQERFPFQFRGKTIAMNAVSLFLKLKEGFEYDDGKPLVFDLLKKEDNGPDTALAEKTNFESAGSPVNNLPHYTKSFAGQPESPGKWSLEVKEIRNLPPALQQKVNPVGHFRLNPEAIEDIYIVCHYSVSG